MSSEISQSSSGEFNFDSERNFPSSKACGAKEAKKLMNLGLWTVCGANERTAPRINKKMFRLDDNKRLEMTLKSPFVSKFSICAIVSTTSLHPDWFIVRILLFPTLFLSFSIYAFLCYTFMLLSLAPSPSLFFYLLFRYVLGHHWETLWDLSSAIDLICSGWEIPLDWHFFNYHSNTNCICRFNQMKDWMARVLEIRYDVFQLPVQEHIEFADTIKLPPTLAGAAVEMNTIHPPLSLAEPFFLFLHFFKPIIQLSVR
jgi:hypothetical protein